MKTYDPATELRLTEAELLATQSEPADKAPVAFLEYKPDLDATALREMSAWIKNGCGCVDIEMKLDHMDGVCHIRFDVTAWRWGDRWSGSAKTIAEAWAALKATEGFPV